MNSFKDRLIWARRNRGFHTAVEAVEAFGWKQSTYLGYESGDRTPHWTKVKQIARDFGVRWPWLLDGEGVPTAKAARRMRLMGYVGAGNEIHPFDGDALGDEIDMPPGTADELEAVRVDGNSMYPRYFAGEIIYYRKLQEAPARFIGRECVVKLLDGRMFVKILRQGTLPRMFNLDSWNAGPIENIAVEWACTVRFRG
jgi:hypothetical protein